jgi:hypothetical protein
MHSSLAVTREGLPLGLAAVKFWTRKKFKGTAALKKKINPTRVPIEKKESIRWLENLKQSTELLDDPGRCVHIGDRESDIYELFCAELQIGTYFLVRTCVDRLAGDGDHTIAKEMNEVEVKGLHRLEVRDSSGDRDEAVRMVGRAIPSEKMSFGSEPPLFGRMAGGAPIVLAMEAAVHCTQGCSGSTRVARKISSRPLAICTIGKPWRP